MEFFTVLSAAIPLVSSAIGAASGGLELRSKIREMAAPSANVLKDFLPHDADKIWGMSRGRDTGNVESLYDALERARPRAQTLLRRLQDHGFVLSGLIVLCWSIVSVSAIMIGWGGWVSIGLLSVGGLVAARCLGPRLSVASGIDATQAGVLIAKTREQFDDARSQALSIKRFFWNPLSMAEVAFLEQYLAARNLVSSLEAAALRIHLQVCRRPLFELYRNSVRDLIAQSIRELVQAKRLGDPQTQKQVLQDELRRLGLHDLVTSESSMFWSLDFDRLERDGKRLEKVIPNALGIGAASDLEHSDLHGYLIESKRSSPSEIQDRPSGERSLGRTLSTPKAG